MSSLVSFMNTNVGRVARILLGLVLVYAGLGVLGGTVGLIVAIIGLAPIVMGIWGRCVMELFVPRAHGA